MPLIDTAELMDVMQSLLSAASSDVETKALFKAASKSETLLCEPMPELNADLDGFAQVYGPNNNLLDQLAVAATNAANPELASLISALDDGLREGQLSVHKAPRPAPRLSRYIYPVV